MARSVPSTFLIPRFGGVFLASQEIVLYLVRRGSSTYKAPVLIYHGFTGMDVHRKPGRNATFRLHTAGNGNHPETVGNLCCIPIAGKRSYDSAGASR
jgi:hypothetical protein